MSDAITEEMRRPSRGRSVGLVPFLFGVTGRASLPGTVLRRLLEDLGLSPDAARALLSRMTRAGQLAGERHGRTVDYRLAGDLARGFERIRDQEQGRPAEWPGFFHAVLYQVPEDRRDFRDALRRAAVLAGYGVLQPGVLISLSGRGDRLDAVLATRPPDARVWSATLGMEPGDAAAAAAVAWGLPDLAGVYLGHIDRLDRGADRPGGGQALRTYTDTLLPVLVDTLREPRLPPALMPADWPGPALQAAIGRFNRVLFPGIEQHVRALLGDR